MNGVIGMLGLLLKTPLSEAQQHQAYLAKTSANALLGIINDILDFSKAEAGKLELEERDFSLQEMLGDFCEVISYRAQEKGIEVVLNMTGVESSLIRADSGRIHQVLNNLVSNAIKFTKEGHVLIEVSLLEGDNLTARLKIKVTDTGIGIPEDKIAILFDSFSQVDTSTTRQYGGTGLGLSIVEQLVTLMNGDVEVSSVLGEGSSFDVDIEVKLSQDSILVKPKGKVEGKRVLIYDENIVSSNALCSQLKHWDMNVTVSRNVDNFLNTYDDSFDIVFIEKSENSFTLLYEVKKYDKTKAVLVTSLRDSGGVDEYMKIGYDAHYPKPVTTNDLLKALDKLCKNNKNEGALKCNNKKEEKFSEKWPLNAKVFVIDDNKVNLLVAHGILEEMGLEADMANNAQEAFDILLNTQNNPYSVVLMDCQMPVMDGYEATRSIRNGLAGDSYVSVPIVAMTANAMEGDKEKCFESGMNDYISKPIDVNLLESILREYIK